MIISIRNNYISKRIMKLVDFSWMNILEEEILIASKK